MMMMMISLTTRVTYAQNTPPTPTRLYCRVEWRRRCEQNSWRAHDDCRRIRSTIWKL